MKRRGFLARIGAIPLALCLGSKAKTSPKLAGEWFKATLQNNAAGGIYVPDEIVQPIFECRARFSPVKIAKPLIDRPNSDSTSVQYRDAHVQLERMLTPHELEIVRSEVCEHSTT